MTQTGPLDPYDPEAAGALPAPAPAAPGPTRVLSLVLSWFVIGFLTLLIFIGNHLPQPEVQSEHGEDAIGLQLMKLQGRFVVGATAAMTDQQLKELLEDLYTGTIPQRLRFIVLAGELRGAEKALDYLDDLEERVADREDVSFTETETQLVEILRALYTDYAAGEWSAPSITEADRDLLRAELEWFGELALAPKQDPDNDARHEAKAPAKQATAVMYTAISLGLLAGVGGLAGLIILIVFWCLRKLPNRIGARLPHGHIYAETFALWLFLWTSVILAISFVTIPPDDLMFVMFMLSLASLIVLAWPLVRGVRWTDLRRDIGWHTDNRLWANVGAGFAGYAMALPLIGIGLIGTVILYAIQSALIVSGNPAEYFGPTGGPAHPIIEYFGQPGVWPRVQVFLVAAVAAPVVEETMFRGVLYRHLRSATATTGVVASIFISAGLNSLIFAMIHPQGWIGVPLLGMLAVAITLAREWRGSLIPSIIIHGTSNGLMMLILMLLLMG